MNFKDERRKLRFLSKVDVKEYDDCWNWVGIFFSNKVLPYGQFWWGEINGKDKTISAHRASWLIHNGGIPEKLQVLHKCNNSKCVNPKHLYLGTHLNNMKDRDECGHTSRGAHRYNFKRTEELKNRLIELVLTDHAIEEICEELKIGRSTYYRCFNSIIESLTKPSEINFYTEFKKLKTRLAELRS